MKTSRLYAFWFNLATLLLPLKVNAWFDSVLSGFHSGPVVMEGKIDGSDALVRGNQAWLKLESEDNAHSSAGIFQLTLNQETGVVNVTTYSSSSPYPDIIIYPTEPVLPKQKTGLPVVDEAPILFELNETTRLIKEHTGSFRQSNDSEVDYRTTHEAETTAPPSQEKPIYKVYKQDPALQPHPVWGVAPNHSDINITLIYEDQSRTTITPSPTTFGQSQSVTFVHQSNTGGTGASPAGSPSPSSEPEPTASGGVTSAGSEPSSQAHATPAASIALQDDNKEAFSSRLKEKYFEVIKKRSSDACTSAKDINMKQLENLFVRYNIRNKTNLSILLQTLCTKECTSRINTLMRESRDSVQQNLTLLYLAAAYNFPDMLKRLLEYGADPNLYEDRYNPLAIAIQRNCSEIIELLLTANTKISPRVYQECFSKNDADLAKRLFRHQKESRHVSSQEGTGKQNCVSENEPIILATRSGKLDFVKLFHQEGCQLDCRGSKNVTLLGIAAWHGNLEVMKYLLAHNADASICLPGSTGGTAMHGAAMVNSLSSVALLLKHMPDIPVNDSGETPLHWSLQGKFAHPAVPCLLLLAGCDPSKENTEQLTAKDFLLKKNVDPSCKRGNWGKICCLLNDEYLLALLKGLIRSPSNYKEIFASCPELSLLLSPEEAQQDITNPNQFTLVSGYTPLHFAVLLGDPKAVWDWTRLGVDLFSYPDDLSFINPVRLARVLGFDDIVMILGVAFSMSGRPCNPSDEDECIAEDKYIAEDKQFLLERYCLTLKNLAAITIFTEYANKKEKIVQYLPTASGKDLLDLPKKLLEKPNPEQQ